jgi:hypothetical protein
MKPLIESSLFARYRILLNIYLHSRMVSASANVARQSHEAIHRFMTFMGWSAAYWPDSLGTAKGTTDFPSDSHFQP